MNPVLKTERLEQAEYLQICAALGVKRPYAEDLARTLRKIYRAENSEFGASLYDLGVSLYSAAHPRAPRI